MKVKIPTQTTCKVHQDSYHNILNYISKLVKYSIPQMKSALFLSMNIPFLLLDNTVLYYNFHYYIYVKLFTQYKGYYFFAEIVTE